MDYLTAEEILFLHFKVIDDFGGSHGVREESRLLSLAEVPRQEVFGAEQYPGVHEKAAVYMRNIIGDHPFSDGNKRTGTVAAGVFLGRNGIKLTAKPKELEDFAVQIAVGCLDIPVIAAWLKAHSKKA